jgi:hypothetical protein
MMTWYSELRMDEKQERLDQEQPARLSALYARARGLGLPAATYLALEPDEREVIVRLEARESDRKHVHVVCGEIEGSPVKV